MNMNTRTGSYGFTLVELLVTIAIVSLLAGLALSSYMNQSRESRRTEAKTAILDLAGREERNYSTTNTYSTVPTQLGYTGAAFPFNTVNNYYSISIAVVAAVAPAPATYTITATAINDQVNDTTCQTYTYTQAGQQTATNSAGGDTTATCWR